MRTVLVVDDEPTIIKLSSVVVRLHEPVRVISAGNGGEALTMVQTEQVDLLITDHRMPVMTGADLIRAVHELPPEGPCILLSAYAGSWAMASESLKDKTNLRSLEKPWDNTALIQTIRALLPTPVDDWHDGPRLSGSSCRVPRQRAWRRATRSQSPFRRCEPRTSVRLTSRIEGRRPLFAVVSALRIAIGLREGENPFDFPEKAHGEMLMGLLDGVKGLAKGPGGLLCWGKIAAGLRRLQASRNRLLVR